VATEVLRKVSLFDGVDDETIQRLYESGRSVRLSEGAYAVRQGEYGDSFFVILRGEAVVEALGSDGRTTHLSRLKAGDYFGELALLGRGERKASVKARTDTVMLELRKVHFDQTLKKHKQVKKRLEDLYTRNSIENFTSQSRYFRRLADEQRRMLIKTSSMQSFSKGDVIATEGQPAQSLFVVRSGFVRISRAVPNAGDEILAYLGPEDFFGDEEATKSAPFGTTAVAVEPVECVVVPRSTVWSLYLKNPELFSEFRRYTLGRTEQQADVLKSKTSMGFVRDMLEAGLGQARSALIINLDVCIRCGNCVQACDDLHGYSRIARRGKKMTRRIDAKSTVHESLYFPTSCLQCAAPECMVGCPTGAISRDIGGEVYIKDTCIGCGNCARNCDFGNISMAARPGPKEDEAAADLIAVKCDVCFQREFAACVYNCPVQAVLRIDPREYFDELRAIAPKAITAEGSLSAAKTTKNRRGSTAVVGMLQLIALVGSTAGGFALHRFMRPSNWSGLGLYAGVAGVVLILILASLGLRKRLRTSKLGSLATWARVHGVLAGLFYGVALFHCGYGANAVMTSALLAMITLAMIVGIGGQFASAWIPRLLAGSEDEALLPEDVGPRISALRAANEELLTGLDDARRQRLERHASKLAQDGLTYLRKQIGPKNLVKALEVRAKKLIALADADHALAIRLAENVAHSRILAARRVFELLLTSWMPIHLVASVMALTLLFGHLMTVVFW
jgi:CRP-like cAMP-binding protein